MGSTQTQKVQPVAGNTEQTRPSNRAYYPALDGYRGVALLLVFATHYLALPWGFTGVDAFFVLSGFLITGILYDTRDELHRVRNFYVRRTLRIFPLYYGLILLLVVLYPVFRWEWNWTWLVWPAYLGNFGRFVHPAAPGSALQMMADAQPLSRTFPKVQLYCGHFWSLCVEEQFYLVWPWIVFQVRDRRKLMYLCGCCFFVCTALRMLAPVFLPAFMTANLVTLIATPFRVDALLIGGLIALLRRGSHAHWLVPIARVGFVVLLGAFIVWHLAHVSEWQSYSSYRYPGWAFTWGLSMTELFYCCVLILTLEHGSVLFRLLGIPSLRWVGRISYGAYVFHDILHTQYYRLGLHVHGYARIATAALALLCTLLVSWISFRWFESPFIRMKDTLAPSVRRIEC